MPDEIGRSSYRRSDDYLNAVPGGFITRTNEDGSTSQIPEVTNITLAVQSAQTAVISNIGTTSIRLYITSKNVRDEERVEIPFFKFSGSGPMEAGDPDAAWLAEGERFYITVLGAYDVHIEAKEGRARIGSVTSPVSVSGLIDAFFLEQILAELAAAADADVLAAASDTDEILRAILVQTKLSNKLLRQIAD